MDKFISHTQMQTILDARPKGVSMDEVINGFRSNGYKIEGIDQTETPSLTTQAKDVAIGTAKRLGRTALGAAQTVQDIGQAVLAPVGGMNPEAGIKALQPETPQGQEVTQALQPTNAAQELGTKVGIGAELLAGGGAGLVKDAVTGVAKLVGKGVAPVANAVKPLGEAIYSRAFTPSVKEAENILAYEATKPSTLSSIYGAGALEGNPVFKPITVADTALRRGIAGTEKQIGVQAKQVADTIYKKEIAPAVKGIKETITKDELFAPLQERINQIVDPSKKAAYENALASLAEDYKNVTSFTFEKAQKLKSELAQFTPAKVFRGQDVANETRMLQSDMANYIRQRTYDALKVEIEPLIQEAKKYKSAEEFVKAQGTPVYRGEGGSNVAQGKALLAEGKHFASDSKYPQGFGKVSENIIKPNVKVLDLGDSTFAEISKKLGIPERRYISPKELSTLAKEKGYDVLKYNGEYKSTGKQFTHFVDLTGDSTITKSQLEEIWKKANKNVEIEPLINIKQKYIDYGNLQELQKVGVKALTEAGTKAGFGGFWSTVYDTAMTPVKTIGGKVIYHIGDKLQVTAPKGFEGKTFADYLRAIGYLAPQTAEKVVNP